MLSMMHYIVKEIPKLQVIETSKYYQLVEIGIGLFIVVPQSMLSKCVVTY